MKTRSAKRKKNFPSDRGDSSASTDLDEILWGTLQHYIDLAKNVYSKLPFEEFFHLRTVCKDWHVIVCKASGLKELIHKPYFNLFTKGEEGRLNGILIYNASSWSWDWRPRWTHKHSFDFVASKGVVYFATNTSSGNSADVFRWQSKTYQRLDLPPTPPHISGKMILGMNVSEKQGPLSSLRVVHGRLDFDTQVYESGVWQTKPCRVPKSETGGPLQATTGSVDCNGRLYITTELTREIFVYNFEKVRWSSLLRPCDSVSKQQPQHYYLDNLGAWDKNVFDVTCDFQFGRKKNWSLQVWELVDETLHKWKVYDCMPKGLCSWLRSTRGFLPPYAKAGDITIQTNFCGDFMLVYSWDILNGWAGKFCLFNMVTKNWQKLNIVAGTIEITEEYSSDPYESDNSADTFDLPPYANESSLDAFMMEDDDFDFDSNANPDSD